MEKETFNFKQDFRVGIGNERSQSAEMVLKPGDKTGGPDNRHKGADQWLYIVGGQGIATVKGTKHDLKPGTMLLIEKGDAHEIRNTGDSDLKTLNVYVPPAYKADGEPLPRGKSE